MGQITITAGSSPSRTTLQTMADQGIIPSNSAPTSPPAGMVWYDTNAAHPLLYVYNGSNWWPVPMGLVAKGGITTMSVPFSIETTINGSELTFSAEADQRYAYEAEILWKCNEANDLIAFKLQQYNGSSWTDIETQWLDQCVANDALQRLSIRTIDGPGAGTSGFRVRATRYYGTGSLQIQGGTDVSITHIGSSTLV